MPQFGWPNTQKPPRGAILDVTHPINQGLALEWLCNEFGGPNVFNQARPGVAAAGTIVNPQGPPWSDGINFATTTYVHTGLFVGGLPGAATAAWTLECWLAATAFASGSSIPLGFAFSAWPSAQANNGSVRAFLVRTSNTIGFFAGQCDWTSTATFFTDGKPHQYVLTTPGGSTTPAVSVYVDGVFKGAGTPSGTAGGLHPAANVNGFSDVFSGGYGATGAMTGRLLRGRIWGRNLSATEIAAAAARPWESYVSPRAFFLTPQPAAALGRRSLYDRVGSRGVA